MKTWQKKVSILSLLFLVVIIIIFGVDSPDPNDCSICGYIKCHAPCILNLATGEIDELQLYTAHEFEVGELTEKQTGGIFGVIQVAGLRGIKLTDPWYIEIDVPMVGDKIRSENFCYRCFQRLECYDAGFVLLDIYDISNPIIYEFEDGAIYDIRCYRIEISAKQEDEIFLLRVDGTL